MGGNALKKTITRRYSKSEYDLLVKDVLSVISPAIPQARLHEVIAYQDKASFGDLDLVVEDLPDVRERLTSLLKSRNHEIVMDKPKRKSKAIKFRAPIWSVSWNDDFQVDLLFQPEKSFDFACFYYNNPDLGNFLGHVARGFGFKMGHKGLRKRLYNGTDMFSEVLVSLDIDAVLSFLGYDPHRLKLRFKTPEDIFEYAASSPYFDAEAFDLKKANYKDRVRDAKRPMYTGFLAWLAKNDVRKGIIIDRDVMDKKAETFFGDYAKIKNAAIASYEKKRRVSKRFCGDKVSRLTGMSGLKLGRLMQSLRLHFDGEDDLCQRIDTMTDKELDALIMEKYAENS